MATSGRKGTGKAGGKSTARKGRTPDLDPSKPLPNERQEMFAQTLAKGMSAHEAYIEAGYKANYANAIRTKKLVYVQARIIWLQNRAAERTIVTVHDIARQLDEDRIFAREQAAASAAVQATMGKAKVLGLIVDKQLVGMKSVDDMTEAELRTLLGSTGSDGRSD